MPPRHHAPYPIPGLNSPFLEALTDYPHLRSIEDLLRLSQQYQPTLIPLVTTIQGEGIDALEVLLPLLQIDEAISTLRDWRELIRLSAAGKAAAILPLPPHISDRLLPTLRSDLIFVADDHLPPHLAWHRFEPLETLMPHALVERLGSLEAVAFEGFLEAGTLRVRRSIGRWLQIMSSHRFRLFVHALPHLPHHGEWVTLPVEHEVIVL